MDTKQYEVLEPYPGWLDEFVTTSEASQITGVPKSTLVTARSRGSNGPEFCNPKGTRIIRYQRRALFEWMFSGGIKKFTEDTRGLIEQLHADNDNEEDL